MKQISDDIVYATCKAPAVERSTCDFKKDGMNAVLEGCKMKCELVEESYTSGDEFSIEQEAEFGGSGGASSFSTYKYPGITRVEVNGCNNIDFTQQEIKSGKTRSMLYIDDRTSFLECFVDDAGQSLKCDC